MIWLKENWFKVGLLAVISITGLSVVYHYVFFIPRKEQIRIEENKQAKTEECLKKVHDSYAESAKILTEGLISREIQPNEYEQAMKGLDFLEQKNERECNQKL